MRAVDERDRTRRMLFGEIYNGIEEIARDKHFIFTNKITIFNISADAAKT